MAAAGDKDLQEYFAGVARARMVVRKVFRIVDEQVRVHGIEPLEHQALIQVFGAAGSRLGVTELADRLDIAVPLASRIARALDRRGLVVRSGTPDDQRVRLVGITKAGTALLKAIDEEVRYHVAHYQRGLTDDDRLEALAIFAFYVGVPATPRDFTSLVKAARRRA